MPPAACHLISQLAHIELVSPAPDDTAEFCTRLLGLTETERSGDAIYLRTWADWFTYSLIIRDGPAPALGHIGWRASGSEELEMAAQRLEADGNGQRWLDDSPGHGPAYRFRSPGGQVNEIFWEVDRFQPTDGQHSTYPNRPQRFAQRGAAVRQLDHTTTGTVDPLADAQWYRELLGFRLNEVTMVGDQAVIAMVSNNEKSHELGLTRDRSGIPGRIHHIAYWVDDPIALLNAADALLEEGVAMEWGPSRHGIGEQYSVYFREPAGHRIEITTGGYRIYQPDWEPVIWSPAQGSRDFYRPSHETNPMIEMFPPTG
jgi:catechol 2,3-dioxygenase